MATIQIQPTDFPLVNCLATV